jgi:rubrerythrin
MEQRERAFSIGFDASGAKLFRRFAFLGDGVGVGKSLMILGHIARLKRLPPIPSIPILDQHSTSQMYSLHDARYTPGTKDIGCLIVVPHTLFRQWQTYIKEQTTLKSLFVQTKKVVEGDGVAAKIQDADVVLVSNTLYSNLEAVVTQNHFLWKRVFYDEADTLHIPSTRTRQDGRFQWLISASWPNLLFPNQSIYLTTQTVNAYVSTVGCPGELKSLLQGSLQQSNYGQYTYMRYYVVSSSFFRELLHTNNPFRGRLILRCTEDFVKESITLPTITIRNIQCRPSVMQQVVANAITGSVRNLLHAGDVTGALAELGVKSEEPMSLVQAVTENRQKELDRLKKTYEFKSQLEYATPQAKEHALQSLKERMKHLEDQIKGLKERIENYKDEMCPICFDEPQTPTLTPCCSRIFCAGCILTSLTRASSCPLCRANIHAGGLRNLATQPIPKQEEEAKEELTPCLKKNDQLLHLLQTVKQGKFLVFSRYDNPFLQLANDIEALNITVKQVRGNKDVIASTLKSFQTGSTKVLLLNSLEAGAGLNITAATHVILLHAMTHEEEKQILGRAYRLGRTEPLEVIRLLHPDELQHVHTSV